MKTKNTFLIVCFFLLYSHYAASQSERTDSTRYEIIHLDQLVRTGAVCHDNTRTRSTGAGACSNHGGVKYWLYAEKSVYQANIQNLPAIPNKSLVRLKPDDVENIIRLGIDVFTYLRNQRREERQQKGYQNENPSLPQDNYEATPKTSHTIESSQKSEKESFHWLYIALLNTLIVILVVFLVFTLVFFVIKKLMEK